MIVTTQILISFFPDDLAEVWTNLKDLSVLKQFSFPSFRTTSLFFSQNSYLKHLPNNFKKDKR